jgi:MOSC domain-containing protein YiiM
MSTQSPEQGEHMTESLGAGRVVSVNVGIPREFTLKGKRHVSAIWKEPVESRVLLEGVNVEGDDQADRESHGGPDQAVYAYALEDYEWWEQELGIELVPGTFGENLTLTGMEVNGALVGEQWEVGETVLEAAQPRFPCFKLGHRMGDPTFPRRFRAAARWGTYLRIIDEGTIAAGDTVTIIRRPDHAVTVDLIGEIYHGDQARAPELLAAPQLPEYWRDWVRTAGTKAEREASG